MVKIYYRDTKTKQIQILNEFKPGSWIHVENPTGEEIDYLEEKFKLEDGLLRDATDIYEVPRLEIEEGIVYIYSRYAYNEGLTVLTAPILVAIGKNFIITVTANNFPYLEKFLNLKNGQIVATTQKIKMFLQLFNIINSNYNTILQNISKKIRAISIQVDKLDNKDIIQFVTFETVLNDFTSALVPTGAVLKNLLSGRVIKLHEEEKDLMEDISLSVGQLIEISQSNLRTIVNIREAYSTIMTNNLNRVIKLFTSLTVILTIPTMIASIYGMNVPLPFQQSSFSFFGIILGLIIISVALILVFIKNRWL